MDENKSLWSAILDDIAKESTMPESDMGVGKKTLMKALGCQRKKKDYENKTPLICAYQAIPLIHPKVPSSSPIGILALSIIAIVVDLTKSVEVIQRSIESWMDNIDQQFKVSDEQLNIAKQNIVEYLKNYKEPTEDDENDVLVSNNIKSMANILNSSSEQQDENGDIINITTPPTTPGSYSNNKADELLYFDNCGIPIIFICTHCESIGIPQRSKIISNYLRSAAYRYRAAICYTSIQESSNMNLLQLQTYLYHRFYPNVFNYHFRGRNDIKNIFIPSGWDNEDKLNTLRIEIEENTRTPTPLTPSDSNLLRREEDDYILDPDCFIDSLFKDSNEMSSTTVAKKSISAAPTSDKTKIASFYDKLRKKKAAKGINKTPTTPKESPHDAP